MADQKIKPAEGNLFVRLVDEQETIVGRQENNEGVIVEVVSVGPKVTRAKAGNTAIIRPWALDGALKFDDMFIISEWSVEATVTG